MRSPKALIIISLLAIAGIFAVSFVNSSSRAIKKEAGFAVVELFTSEGCSSCPSADALIARLQNESSNKAIYILAFHVDYWNHLGWKDAFSSAQYSERQRNYARWLKLSSVYTPQVVVNGRTEFVGSEESSLRNALSTNLKKPAKNELGLSNIKITGSKVSVSYKASQSGSNDMLLLALIEKNATTKVQRGENSGRTLTHVQIVSNLKAISLKDGNTGTQVIVLPGNFNAGNYEIIGFIQNDLNGEITAAAKADLKI